MYVYNLLVTLIQCNSHDKSKSENQRELYRI